MRFIEFHQVRNKNIHAKWICFFLFNSRFVESAKEADPRIDDDYEEHAAVVGVAEHTQRDTSTWKKSKQ